MSASHTGYRSRPRRMLDRFTGGPPKPLGAWGKAWVVFVLLLVPLLVYYVFLGEGPLLWKLPALCFAVAGVAGALSRLWHRRLAYGLHAAGALTFHAGTIVLIVGVGIRGEWGMFVYGCEYAVGGRGRRLGSA